MRSYGGNKKVYDCLQGAQEPGLHDFRFEVDGGLFRAFGSTEIKDGALRCLGRPGARRVDAYA